MRAALAHLTVLAAAPAAAQELPLPSGCIGVATVQLPICTVVTVWTCDTGATREIWSYSQTATTGVVYQRDADGNRIASYTVGADGATATSRTLASADPVSIAALAATGQDGFDTEVQNLDGSIQAVTGTMRVMGAAIDADGWRLVPVVGSYAGPDALQGYYLMDAGRGILFHTAFTRTPEPAASFPAEFLPVDVAFPGEAGFLASEPVHGCGG